MKNQFVPYEIAVKLKELGFKEECICYYSSQTKSFIGVYNSKVVNDIIENHSHGKEQYYNTPLWQQVIDWFISKHLIFIVFDMNFGWVIHSKNQPLKMFNDQLTYYKGRENAIEHALELI
jgi:predicted transcriptional regulator